MDDLQQDCENIKNEYEQKKSKMDDLKQKPKFDDALNQKMQERHKKDEEKLLAQGKKVHKLDEQYMYQDLIVDLIENQDRLKF